MASFGDAVNSMIPWVGFVAAGIYVPICLFRCCFTGEGAGERFDGVVIARAEATVHPDTPAGGLAWTELCSLIPTVQYSAGGSAEAAAECAVCLGELKEGQRVKVLPGCSHQFHAGCISTWLAYNSTCPLCRREVRLQKPALVIEVQ